MMFQPDTHTVHMWRHLLNLNWGISKKCFRCLPMSHMLTFSSPLHDSPVRLNMPIRTQLLNNFNTNQDERNQTKGNTCKARGDYERNKTKVRKNAHCQNIVFIEKGLHPLDRRSFWIILKNIFSEKYGIFPLNY